MYLNYSGTLSRLRHAYFKKLILRLSLPDGAKVLDYGCGPGDFIEIAKLANLDVFGADNSDRSILLAKRRGIDVFKGDSSDLLSRPERYDAIVVQSVLEHVRDPLELVSNLVQILKPGGLLVLSAPTPGPFFWDDPTHVRPHTPKSLALIGEIAGLKREYLGYVFAFLLGVEISSPVFFQLLNVLPASLGSNLVAFLRRPLGA